MPKTKTKTKIKTENKSKNKNKNEDRNVQGFDRIVYLEGETAMPKVEETKDRWTADALKKKFSSSSSADAIDGGSGCTNKPVFIGNKNVHCFRRRLRGAIAYFSILGVGIVGLILGSKGHHGVMKQLYPKEGAGEPTYVDLRYTGFYLEQVLGPPVAKFTVRKKFYCPWNLEIFPMLSKRGHVKMNPQGPDICVVPAVPPELQACIATDDWTSESNKPGKKKAQKKDKEVPVVYVFSKPDHDPHHIDRDENKKPVVNVPVGGPVERKDPANNSSRFYYQKFVDVSVDSVSDIGKQRWTKPEEFAAYVEDKGTNPRIHLVPKLVEGQLRVKVVDQEEYSKILGRSTNKESPMEKATSVCGKILYLFGFENSMLDHRHSYGILVSYWGLDPLVTKLRLSYGFAKAALSIFRKGLGSRPRSPCHGLNSVRGPRGSCRPHPGPFTAKEDIPKHQYFNENGGNYLLQPYIERKLHDLLTQVEYIAKRENPMLMEMIGEGVLTMGILTSGYVPRPTGGKKRSHDELMDSLEWCIHTWSLCPPYSFVNGLHVDFCDKLFQKELAKWIKRAKKKGWKHCLRLLKWPDFCLPTTCGYQFVYKDEQVKKDLTVKQFFCMDGLGLAVEIQDGIAHHFHGAAFSHRTSLCVCQRESDGMLSTSNFDDNFLVVAWGSASGGTEAANADNEEGNEEGSEGDDEGGEGGGAVQPGILGFPPYPGDDGGGADGDGDGDGDGGGDGGDGDGGGVRVWHVGGMEFGALDRGGSDES